MFLCTFAQNKDPKMLKFVSFGSGSSGNCYYLCTATDGLLIDIGVGLRTLKKHFRDYGISLNTVSRILITHDHADHIKSVGAFSHDYHVPVYATQKVHDGIDQNYCIQRKVADEMKRLVEPGVSVKLGDFTVTPFPVPHDANENVGYQIDVEGVCFVVLTDIGSVTEEIKERIRYAHYLIIEANHDVEMLNNGPYPAYLKARILSANGHLSNAECGHALAENMSEHLRHVWLCHLSEENNHPELARKTVETILRSYGIIPGKDLQLEVLKRKMPSGVYELETDCEDLSLF
jgi:phosphoribosyl 1,2-cyclic phosphodiesterase